MNIISRNIIFSIVSKIAQSGSTYKRDNQIIWDLCDVDFFHGNEQIAKPSNIFAQIKVKKVSTKKILPIRPTRSVANLRS